MDLAHDRTTGVFTHGQSRAAGWLGHGLPDLPAGVLRDDTSMALCLAEGRSQLALNEKIEPFADGLYALSQCLGDAA